MIGGPCRSGSRWRAVTVLGLLALATGLLAGCGGDGGGDDDLRAEIRDEMLAGDDQLTREEADCFAGVMVDEIDNDLLRDAIEGGDIAEDGLGGMDAVADRALAECFDLGDLVTTTTAG